MRTNKVVFMTGPSGCGKTTISSQLADLGIPTMDLDTVPGVNQSLDGIGNAYDIAKVLRLIMSRDEAKPLVIFGLASNVLELMHKLEQRGAMVGLLSVSNEEIIRRRLARGKAFDRSLDSQGHRQDLHKFHKMITPHTRFEARSAEELISIITRKESK